MLLFMSRFYLHVVTTSGAFFPSGYSLFIFFSFFVLFFVHFFLKERRLETLSWLGNYYMHNTLKEHWSDKTFCIITKFMKRQDKTFANDTIVSISLIYQIV